MNPQIMTLSQRAELNALRERYRAKLEPLGPEQELALEQVARSAWAIQVLEAQEAEVFAAHRNPDRSAAGRRSLLGLSVLRRHYCSVYQGSLRLFMRLAARRGRGNKALAKPSRARRTR
jgi:hypothetical protein